MSRTCCLRAPPRGKRKWACGLRWSPNGIGSQTMGGLRGDDDGAGRPTVAVLTTWARGSARKEVAAGVSVGTRADVEAGGGADAAMRSEEGRGGKERTRLGAA